jgi:hypothetical protein
VQEINTKGQIVDLKTCLLSFRAHFSIQASILIRDLENVDYLFSLTSTIYIVVYLSRVCASSLKNKLRGLSPQAKYNDRATAAVGLSNADFCG